MKKCTAISFFALCLLLLASTVMSGNRPCFKYEPAVVELTGIVRRVVFPGPPNYESIKDGDKPEPYWVLFLSEAICVDEDPASEINRAETKVTKLQLNVDSSERYRRFLEKKCNRTR